MKRNKRKIHAIGKTFLRSIEGKTRTNREMTTMV
jgi:S-adenosylmethionine:tRNA-ribosyltransferase-isomerase (queuine synthetase)